jgi:hypothetical protein
MSQPGSKISQGNSYRELPNKAYQSTRAFNSGSGALFTYSTTVNSNLQTVGSLVVNTASSAANCPAGRVVHANGKVLIPGVNPGGGVGVSPATGSGSTTPNPLPFPMIGVYDPVSGLNGYINPHDPTWAAYDASLSAFYNNAGTPATTLAGQGAEPRFGAVFIGSAGTTTPSFSTGTAHAGLLTCTTGSVTAITVLNTSVTASSVILVTLQGAGTAALRVSAITAGTSFVVTPSAALSANDVIHFLIVN